MADNIVGGLFGVDPQQLMRQRQAADEASAYRFANLDNMQRAQYSIAKGASGLGRAVGGLLGGDPELEKVSAIKQLSSQFDLTSATGMRDFARSLQTQYPQEAMMAAKRADEMEQAGLTRKKTEALTTKALREKDTPSSNLGKLITERDALIAGGMSPNDPRIKAYEKAIASAGEGNAPKISVGVSAIDKEGNLRSSFLTEAKPYRDPFIAAGKIENLLTSESSLADKISKKQWGKLAGDATISNKDTDSLTQYGDLGTRLNGILTQFAEGKYSDEQRKEAVNLARQIKAQSESGYNSIRTDYLSRAEAEKLDPKTVSYIAPVLPKTSRSFVVGKVYADKNGQQGIFEGYNTDGTPKFKPANK
jgi:hypothetical protein